jgi:transposase
LRRIGIDEISYRKGHRYLTVVIDHDAGRMVWAHEGRNKETLEKFFTAPGDTRAALLTHVSADGAEWIHTVIPR